MTTRNLTSSPKFRPRGVSPFAGDVDGVLLDITKQAAKDKAFIASLTQSTLSLSHDSHSTVDQSPVRERVANGE